MSETDAIGSAATAIALSNRQVAYRSLCELLLWQFADCFRPRVRRLSSSHWPLIRHMQKRLTP